MAQLRNILRWPTFQLLLILIEKLAQKKAEKP